MTDLSNSDTVSERRAHGDTMADQKFMSFDQYLAVLTASRLVEPPQLRDVLAEIAESPDGKPKDCFPLARRLQAKGLITYWQNGHLLKERSKGFFIGNYKLLDYIGSGGMSTVYLAEHRKMHRKVAIKVLIPSKINSVTLHRFERECRAVAALDHVNIVRAHDFDKDGKLHYFVMEYVDGPCLQTVVAKQGPLDYQRAANYIYQAARGLEHAHQAGMVHRDIKPSNLLLDSNGVVKVLDLGVARVSTSDDSITLASDQTFLGTIDYMAPEQALNSHEVDQRADIYSLGCTLYYLVTGSPPFPEGQPAQKLLAHQLQMPPSVREQCAEMPEKLAELIERMLAKSASERPQSMSELCEEMAEYASFGTEGGTQPSSREVNEAFGPIRLACWSPGPAVSSTDATLLLGRVLAEAGHRVLACDLQPQALLSGHLLGSEVDHIEEDLSGYLQTGGAFPPPAMPTKLEDLFLLPTRPVAQGEAYDAESSPLGGGLAHLGKFFHWTLLDLPYPHQSLTEIGFRAATCLLVPVELSDDAIDRIPAMIDAVNEATVYNPDLKILGVLPVSLQGAATENLVLTPDELCVLQQLEVSLSSLGVPIFSSCMCAGDFRLEGPAGSAPQRQRLKDLYIEVIEQMVARRLETVSFSLTAQECSRHALEESNDLYAEQREMLNELGEFQSAERYVSRFVLAKTEQGRQFSFCVSLEGEECLLPRTDFLVLVAKDRLAFRVVPWSEVDSTALLRDNQLYPERYRFSSLIPTA